MTNEMAQALRQADIHSDDPLHLAFSTLSTEISRHTLLMQDVNARLERAEQRAHRSVVVKAAKFVLPGAALALVVGLLIGAGTTGWWFMGERTRLVAWDRIFQEQCLQRAALLQQVDGHRLCRLEVRLP